MRARLRRIPLPLALILAVAALVAVAWMVVLPPFQGPDEDSHFSYAQRIVENGSIPWRPGGQGAEKLGYSNELGLAEDDGGFKTLIGNTAARPLWTEADVALWERQDAALTAADRGGNGYVASLKNPPAYYLYAAVPYAVAGGGSIFDRLMWMRLWNIPLLLISLVFVWLVIGELAGRGWPQVLGTAASACIPQFMNVVAEVTPDIGSVAEWSAALYVMLLILRRGPRLRLIVVLAALCVLAGFTHPRGLPIVVPAVLTVVIAVARERRWRVLGPWRVAAGLGAVYVALVLAISTLGQGGVHQFGSYLWQFYLPRLGFMTPKIGPAHYGFREAFVDRLYSGLAWLEVTVPGQVERVLWWGSLAALAAFVVVLVVRRRGLRARSAEAAVLLTAVLALLLGLHLAAYRAMLTNPGDPIVTARYLLPLLPLFGTVLALIGRTLPPRLGALFAGLIVAAGVALQFESLGLLLERFYA